MFRKETLGVPETPPCRWRRGSNARLPPPGTQTAGPRAGCLTISLFVCVRGEGPQPDKGAPGTGSVGAGHNVGWLESAGGPRDRASITSAHVHIRRLARVGGRAGRSRARGGSLGEIDHVLTTVLFTDIVGSTTRAASLGDQRWRSLLDARRPRLYENNFGAFVGMRSAPPGTGSWPPSTVPLGRFAVPRKSPRPAERLGIELPRWVAHRRMRGPGRRPRGVGGPYRRQGGSARQSG